MGIAVGSSEGADEGSATEETARTPNGFVIQCPYIPPEIVDIPSCQGRPATCVGTEGDDLLWGTEDSEVIVTLGGDDVVQADEGDDIICLGPGNDAAHGARGDDFIFGGEGNDWLFGARGNDSLYGEEGNRDVLFGGPDLDYLDGGAGDRDVCIQQRDEAKVNEDSCEVIFPPPGFNHNRAHAFEPGIVESAMPGGGERD
jgi:Ca2+-binding RTX toxin-like protein